MKVALCLSGHLRTYDKTYPSVVEQLYNKYDVDTFISTWRNLGNKKYAADDPLPEGEEVDPQAIIKMYNPISMVMDDAKVEPISNILKKEYEKSVLGNGDKMSQLMIMLYKIWHANKLKLDHETKNNFKYDVVIRARFDVYFKPLKMETALDKIQATPGCIGVTDFVFAGPSLLMDDLCGIYEVLTPDIPFNTAFQNIDQMWSTHLNNNNIPFHSSFDNFDYLRYASAGIFDSKGNKVG